MHSARFSTPSASPRRARRLRRASGTIRIRPPTAGKNILYSSFTERPKHLDPAQSYTSDECDVHAQIYEPPLQYHYLKRPYELIPLSAASRCREPRYLDADGTRAAAGSPASAVAFSDYEIRIRPRHPLPAAPRVRRRRRRQAALSRSDRRRDQAQVSTLADFKQTGTRELNAEDYVYQIKRLAHPRAALADLRPHGRVHRRPEGATRTTLQAENQRRDGHAAARRKDAWLDLAQLPARRRRGRRPATPTASAQGPVPAVRVLAGDAVLRAGARRRPTVLRAARHGGEEPHARLVAGRHRAVHADREQPERAHGARAQSQLSRRALSRPRASRSDAAAGLLADAGKTDAVHRPSRLQPREGRHPATGTSSCRATTTCRASAPTTSTRRCASIVEGEASLTPEMEERGIRLRTSVAHQHVLPRVQLARSGGRRALRARAQAAPGDLDRGRLGGVHLDLPATAAASRRRGRSAGHLRLSRGRGRHESGRLRLGGRQGRSASPIEAAKKLLAEAGYPDGRDAKTGQPLVLYFDTIRAARATSRGSTGTASSSRSSRSSSSCATPTGTASRRRCARATPRSSSVGWNADYPDPENFLFLLHGPQSRAKTRARTRRTTQNPEFDRAVRADEEHAERSRAQAIIDRMLEILRARTRPGSGASTPRTTASSHAGSATSSRTRWPATASSTIASTPAHARGEARGVEPARCCGRSALAARRARLRARCRRSITYRRRERAAARPRLRRCSPTSSGACSTRSRS